MVKIYKQPFAHDGDTIEIPDTSQPDGKMSSVDGWTPDYQLPKTDPNYKPVDRQEMNGVFKEVTEALGQVQQFGFSQWQAVDGGWPQGANVNHGGGVWQSLSNSNTEEPGAGALWKPIVFDDIGQTTETDLGLVRLATAAQAQALVDDASALTPAKLAAAFGGGNQGLTANGYQKLPGGLIIQWGVTQNDLSDIYAEITLPIAFPNAFLEALSTCKHNVAVGISSVISSHCYPVSLTKIGLGQSGVDDIAPSIMWLAIGY